MADAPVAMTAVASTSGTSIDFTGIPSTAKRITVMFSGVSTNGSSNLQVQIGSGSFTTSGYLGAMGYAGAGSTAALITTGFGVANGFAASGVIHGGLTIVNISSNSWVAFLSGGYSSAASTLTGGGSVSLAGVLDRVRFTTVNGTDTFDAGTINIFYE